MSIWDNSSAGKEVNNSNGNHYRWYFRNIFIIPSEPHGPYDSYEEACAAGKEFDRVNDLSDNGLDIWCFS